MADKSWKRAERRIAKIFGTSRTPLSGSHSRITSSDIIHNKLFVEVKYRRHHPVIRWFKEALKRASKEKKIPIVVLVQKQAKTPFVLFPLNRKYLNELRKNISRQRRTRPGGKL